MYDYCRVHDEALRFENMIAVELSRAVTLWNDFGLGEYELWYLRNKQKEEVDFLVTKKMLAEKSEMAMMQYLLPVQRTGFPVSIEAPERKLRGLFPRICCNTGKQPEV